MTLKEAIERYTSNAEYERIHGSLQGCLDFRQLAEWLKDYERLLDQKPKTGHWIYDKCSVCGKGIEDLISSSEWYRNEEPNFCPFCGVKLDNNGKLLEVPTGSESENKKMYEQMDFPETFEKFAKEYGFKDDKEVYTNGSDLIPIFRVKQWLEHDNKLRTISKGDNSEYLGGELYQGEFENR